MYIERLKEEHTHTHTPAQTSEDRNKGSQQKLIRGESWALRVCERSQMAAGNEEGHSVGGTELRVQKYIRRNSNHKKFER